MGEKQRWDHYRANEISHLCQYLNFFGLNAAWIKSPFVTVSEKWRLACLFLPPRSWLVKRRRSIEIPWVIRQRCNISPLKASYFALLHKLNQSPFATGKWFWPYMGYCLLTRRVLRSDNVYLFSGDGFHVQKMKMLPCFFPVRVLNQGTL